MVLTWRYIFSLEYHWGLFHFKRTGVGGGTFLEPPSPLFFNISDPPPHFQKCSASPKKPIHALLLFFLQVSLSPPDIFKWNSPRYLKCDTNGHLDVWSRWSLWTGGTQWWRSLGEVRRDSWTCTKDHLFWFITFLERPFILLYNTGSSVFNHFMAHTLVVCEPSEYAALNVNDADMKGLRNTLKAA